MSLLKKTRVSQDIKSAYFEWNFDDTILDTSGVSKDFGATTVASFVIDAIALPRGAVIVGGTVVRETAFDAATYTISVGDSGSATRYLSATDLKATGLTALVPTGYKNSGALPVRLTIVPADACTTGKARVRVDFYIDGNANEVTAGGL